LKKDYELLSEYINNKNVKSFEEIILRYQQVIYNTCLKILRDSLHAEDATQGVFLVLMKRAKTLKREINLSGWLHRAAIYICKNINKKEIRNKIRETEYVMKNKKDLSVISGRAEAQAIRRLDENSAIIEEALAALPKRYSIPIIAHYFREKTSKEISEDLSIPLSTVTTRISRGIEKLRKKLGRKGMAGISTGILIKYLGISSAEAVPAGLTASLCALATTGTTSAVIITAATATITAMEVAKMKIIIGSIIGAVIIGAGGYGVKEIPNSKSQISNEKNMVIAGGKAVAAQKTKKKPEAKGPRNIEKGLQVTIQADKDEYKTGEWIKVKVQLENVGYKTFNISTWGLGYSAPSHLDIIITGPDGNKITDKARIKDLIANKRKRDFRLLGYRESYGKQLCSGGGRNGAHIAGYMFRKPGNYTISLVYSNTDDGKKFGMSDVWIGSVTSNTITVRVMEEKEQEALKPRVEGPRYFRIPSRLVVKRSANQIKVSADMKSLHSLCLEGVGKNMFCGFKYVVFVDADGVKVERLKGLGSIGANGTVNFSGIITGQLLDNVVIEVQFCIFETDIPPQHMWNPAQGRYYEFKSKTIRSEKI
jgi:RNA polymerase sigma factor (sigma-70 family)